MYDTVDELLKSILRDYYEKQGNTSIGKLNFLILLFASGEFIPTIQDKLKDISIEKKLLSSAAAIVFFRFILKKIFSGPLSIILSTTAIASLVMVFINNYSKIISNIESYKEKIDKLKNDYDDIQQKYHEGKYSLEERNLIIEGLKTRFLMELN